MGFDIFCVCGIIYAMKKILLFLICVSTLVIAGCGVKSGLTRPDGPLRDYPVY